MGSGNESVLGSRWGLEPTAFTYYYYPVSHPSPGTIGIVLAAFLALASAVSLLFPSQGNRKLRVPIYGPTDTIRARWQFFRNALTLVTEGYNKVRIELPREHTVTRKDTN